jgi:hypothetical protein
MRRRDHLAERLEEAEQSLADNRAKVDGYSISVMEHRIGRLQSDLAWLDQLISSEHDASTGRKEAGA